MGGVNIAEESQRMQGTIVAGTQIRSCKDETFLQTGLLHKRIARICREQGLDEPASDVIALVSHATQDRLKTLLEKLSVISEHRLDIVRQEGEYDVTQDVKGQLRFLGELDKIERRRHEEAERELLYRYESFRKSKCGLLFSSLNSEPRLKLAVEDSKLFLIQFKEKDPLNSLRSEI